MVLALHTISSNIHEFIAVLMFNESEYPKKCLKLVDTEIFTKLKITLIKFNHIV